MVKQHSDPKVAHWRAARARRPEPTRCVTVNLEFMCEMLEEHYAGDPEDDEDDEEEKKKQDEDNDEQGGEEEDDDDEEDDGLIVSQRVLICVRADLRCWRGRGAADRDELQPLPNRLQLANFERQALLTSATLRAWLGSD